MLRRRFTDATDKQQESLQQESKISPHQSTAESSINGHSSRVHDASPLSFQSSYTVPPSLKNRRPVGAYDFDYPSPTYWVMDPLTPEDSLLIARTAETRERTKKQEEINILTHNTSTAEDATFGGLSYELKDSDGWQGM